LTTPLSLNCFDTEGFDQLITFSEDNNNPSRGSDAWAALRDHYYRAGGKRIHELFTQFMKPQMEHETRSGFITRVVNKRLEIKHSGVEIPMEQLKAALLGELHEIYQSDIAYLHITDVPDAAYLQSKLTQLCNSVDQRKQKTAERSHASAHFGSVNDAFGYQQPPQRCSNRPASTSSYRQYYRADG
jgi:hypothetical protein